MKQVLLFSIFIDGETEALIPTTSKWQSWDLRNGSEAWVVIQGLYYA